ncbi:ankyrin repeat domain containing protein 10 [Dermatophagoides farinae]|uniref:Ankyrin repeat domain containing protein 10 n=1 Tax=Dermatophagoides farinae TaxID=6954 RepID=A0A9D4P8D8_DERFA|nr:NF-kappa-B inhibitor alpha-like [Dermatophagoides farinae]KAH7645852.1 ankyrin repeat domain containing protein 10 [Dermatophagoides farinae]
MSHEKKSSHQHHHRECEYKMDSDIDIDSKEKTFEGLFDSGYNSNIQSKTFLDLDNEEFDNSSLSNQQQHLDRSQQSNSNRRLPLTQQQTNDANDKNKFDTVQQWSDSGVCITDSGLSIQEDFENYDPIDSNENDQESKQQKIDTQQSHLLANDSNDNKNALELWLKHNSDAETLLHLAIIEGLEDIACSIIKNLSTSNEMLNSFNYLYQNPLHLAILKRQINVIPLLIIKGVSLTFQDNLGNTPLHIACKYSLVDIVEIILATASNKSVSKCFEIRNYDGDTCLHLAAYNNDLKLLELFIRSGAHIDIQEGKSGKTILHWAIENLRVQLVGFLLKNQANIQAETFAGKTPLHFLLKSSIIKQNNQHDLTSSTSLTQSNKSKIYKIIRMSIEYCNEKKLSLDAISHVSDDTDTSENES